MKSFLTKGKKPIVKWGMIPENIMFKGKVPEGYSLAISPSEGMIVVDVDRHNNIDGFDNIPNHLKLELNTTLNYHTKNNGKHYWFKYTGDKYLANKTSNLGIDLRTNKGYVVWYPEYKIENNLRSINYSSKELNKWLEELFSYVNKK